MEGRRQIVISFDDTGSMASVRGQVRQKASQLVDELFKINPNTEISIIIHNDYCDHDTIQFLDLTDDKTKILKFINNSSSRGGGDSDECYELVLNYFHEKVSWTSENKIAILIGDANPHEAGYRYGGKTYMMDWRTELVKCSEANIKVYPIQALGWGGSRTFYGEIARICGTVKLDLSQFAHITQYINAIIYNEQGQLQDYQNSDPMFSTNISLKNMFARLRGEIEEKVSPYSWTHRETSVSVKDRGEITDLSSIFQVMEVGSSSRIIKEFVEDNGIRFKVGKGFYQLVLTENIQASKEVLFVHKTTGEVKSDTKWCRQQLGVPLGTKGRVNPKTLACAREYDIFVQSTSYNRKLDKNTQFLYELDHV